MTASLAVPTTPDPDRAGAVSISSGGTLPGFPRLLLGFDGTVTQLLEVWSGEAVEAAELRQTLGRASSASPSLDIVRGAPVLRRQVVLRGIRSGRAFLHATATVAVNRVPSPVLDALLATGEPIGRVLASHRVETFREVLASGRQAAGDRGRHFGLARADELLYRTYRIVRGGRPMMLITERIPDRPVVC